MSPYKEVPASAAERIADEFEKDFVIVFAGDIAHKYTHMTSWGRTARDKSAAAHLGDMIASHLELSKAAVYEDFRATPQAIYKERVDLLRKALDAAAHALRSYQYGNAAPELALEVAEFAEAALEKTKMGSN